MTFDTSEARARVEAGHREAFDLDEGTGPGGDRRRRRGHQVASRNPIQYPAGGIVEPAPAYGSRSGSSASRTTRITIQVWVASRVNTASQ